MKEQYCVFRKKGLEVLI